MVGSRHLPLARDDVEREVLHRRIKDLLDGAGQAVDLVDEQHVARAEVRQQRREVAGLFDRRAARDAQVHAELVRDDARERRLAEARRTVEQHVVERLIAPARGLDVDGQIALGLLLAGIVGQQLRAQADLALVLRRQARGDDGRVVLL